MDDRDRKRLWLFGTIGQSSERDSCLGLIVVAVGSTDSKTASPCPRMRFRRAIGASSAMPIRWRADAVVGNLQERGTVDCHVSFTDNSHFKLPSDRLNIDIDVCHAIDPL